jgi:hypothetical protein
MKRASASLGSAVLCLAFGLTLLSGCGSSSSPSSTPSQSQLISLSLSTGSSGAAPTIDAGQSVKITATILNDSANAGVKWSLTGGGSLSGKAPTSAVYFAPTSVAAAVTSTVTATSVSDSSKSASVKITVDPGVIGVTISPSVTFPLCVDQVTGLSAVVTNDPHNAGVSWSLSGLGSVGNETPTAAAFTAPASLPLTGASTSFVTATSVTDPTKSASVQIGLYPFGIGPAVYPVPVYYQAYSAQTTVCGGVPPYTFTLKGFVPAGLVLNSSTGLMSGTPTYPSGGFDLVITAFDSQKPIPNTAQNQQQLPIDMPSILTILTDSLPQGGIGESYNQTLLATSGTPPYDWNVPTGSLPTGMSLNSSTGAISGTPSASGTYNFTMQVTDSATPAQATYSRNLSVTVQPQLALVTTSLPAGTVGAFYSQPLQATGGVPGYVFSESSLPPGFAMDQLGYVLTGLPTAAGSYSIPVTANDSAGGSANGNVSLTIAAESCPNNPILQGNYAFLFGAPGGGEYENEQFIGDFIADGNGNVTQGYVDSDNSFGYESGGINPAGTLSGTYCIGANNLGTLQLTGLEASNTTTVLEVTLQASGNGGNAIAIFDSSSSGLEYDYFGGSLFKQNTSAFNTTLIAGNYAFGLIGGGESSGSGAVQAGAFTADGAGNVNNGELDDNDGGSLTSAASFSGSGLVVATNGRGTVTLNANAFGTLYVIFYVVNDSQMLALELRYNTEKGEGFPPVDGMIVQQAPGSFSNGSLNGVSVAGLESTDIESFGCLPVNGCNSGLPEEQVGLFAWDGNGTFTVNGDQNDGGTMDAPSYSGTYSVASNGRVTLTAPEQANSPILYLTGPNQGFVMGTYLNTTFGSIYNQSGSPFGTASLIGNYVGGNWQIMGSSGGDDVNLEVDTLTSDGVGDVAGTSDYLAVSVPGSSTISGTYAVSSNGRGTITQNGGTTNIFYLVSPTQLFMIPSGNSNPNLVMLSQ